jgi:hypothetical protein
VWGNSWCLLRPAVEPVTFCCQIIHVQDLIISYSVVAVITTDYNEDSMKCVSVVLS